MRSRQLFLICGVSSQESNIARRPCVPHAMWIHESVEAAVSAAWALAATNALHLFHPQRAHRIYARVARRAGSLVATNAGAASNIDARRKLLSGKGEELLRPDILLVSWPGPPVLEEAQFSGQVSRNYSRQITGGVGERSFQIKAAAHCLAQHFSAGIPIALS